MQQYGMGLQSYKEQAVATMTQGEMLILLYDEIIKRLRKGKILMENGDFEAAESDLKRAREIVAHLEANLDRKYEISAELRRLYRFFDYQIARVVAGRKLEVIDEVIPLVEDMREAFKQADVLNRQKNPAGQPPPPGA